MKHYPYWWDSLPAVRSGGESTAPNGSDGARFSTAIAEPRETTTGGSQSDRGATLPARTDVVIVGAGYTGLAAARQLAGSGAAVVVVESERVGWGASSRNGGQVLTGMKLDPATLVARFGEARARDLFNVSLESIAALEHSVASAEMQCEYTRSGHVQAASKPSHYDGFQHEQSLLARVFNHPVELVPAAAQLAEIGSNAYHGLMIDQRSGALNPALYVTRLAAAAARAGATIAEHTEVSAVRRTAATWTVTTSRGSIRANELLVATNGYATIATPWLRRRLVPIGSYIIATAPLTAAETATLIPRQRMVFDSKYFLHYFRLTRDQRLLFGGRAEFAQPTAATTARCADILRRDMLAVFPSLATTPIDYAWGGNVAFTRDQMPHAGRLGGAFYAGGYCGHGVAMAGYLGALVARRMAGELIDHPLFDDHFQAIPFYHGTPWFLPIAGAYYKLLDWLQ